jgi:hypothetical protein
MDPFEMTDEEWQDYRPVWPLDVAWFWAMVAQAVLLAHVRYLSDDVYAEMRRWYAR